MIKATTMTTDAALAIAFGRRKLATVPVNKGNKTQNQVHLASSWDIFNLSYILYA